MDGIQHQKIRRNSSVELIKVIAILLIITSHSIPNGGFTVSSGCIIHLENATHNLQYLILGIVHNFGQIGNDLFVVSSAWYMVDQKKIRTSKILSLILDCFVISVAMLIGFTIAGYKLPIRFFIMQLFPISFSTHWFLTSYLLFYAISPLLKKALDSMTQKELLAYNCLFVFLYSFMRFVFGESVFNYSKIIGFIEIYFIVAYVKKYLPNVSRKSTFGFSILALGLVGWFAEVLLTNELGLHIGAFSNQVQKWNDFANPCFILISIGAILIAQNHNFYNHVINYYSSLSLLVYLFHCNIFFREYLRYEFFGFIYLKFGYEKVIIWVLVFAFLSFAFGSVMAILYQKAIQKFVLAIAVRMDSLLRRVYYFFEKLILKIN